MAPSSTTAAGHRVVSREAWLKERIALMKEEKEFTQRRDELASKARAMSWVKVEKAYTFDTPSGPASLGDLFGDQSQLIVYHFMFDPTWSQGCKSCSFVADHYNGLVAHLAHRDISFVTVSKAPIEKIEQFRKRMNWGFRWVSDGKTDFGRDYGVSFTDQELLAGAGTYNFDKKAPPIRELPGILVFVKDGHGTIYQTYATFSRGLEDFLTAYRYMDITPKGRDEDAGHGMDWLRHHDRYGDAVFVHPWLERPGITGPAMK